MTHELENDIERVMYSAEDIRAMVRTLGDRLSRDYAGKKPLLVVILKGSMVFAADLLRCLTIDCTLDFMVVSSYKGEKSTGEIDVKLDLREDIRGRDVIIVEDIIDTGITLSKLKALLESRRPASLKICTLLNKPSRRDKNVTVTADYVGCVVGNEFIVGYGLDYNEKYRNLPYIGIMKK